MYFMTKQKDTFGNWRTKRVEVLNIINEPLSIRGQITGSNWSVKYIVPSTLGNGKQVNSRHFSYKKEAIEFIDGVKNS